uniref:SWIM-type zinc finger 7 associated protein 1 n=1 Tax=Monopterus albus TaxID=43700 RepID=A0A3Q3Q0T7_MONAL
MADILTLVFRTFMSQTGLQKDLSAAPPPPTARSALLVGEPNISRSVLLLAAVTAASEAGMRVIFFSQTQIQSLPASLPIFFFLLLKKIRFSYPRTVEELLQQVASLHEPTNTSPTPPSLIIVDRLESFLRAPGEQSCAAHLCALLCDTAAFLTHILGQQSSSAAPCRVLASFQSEVDPGQRGGEASATQPVLDVLDRYFLVRYTLDRDTGYEATAAGLQEIWHIYLSGSGVTEVSGAKDCEDTPAVAQDRSLDVLLELDPSIKGGTQSLKSKFLLSQKVF